ncbi:MAG: hypothetical protein AABY42_06965, partial [Nitrospirota bacterium]
TYDASNFSADGRKWQPAPTGHTPGKDNGAGTGTHNTGEDCGICHKPGGKAPNHVFTMSGTLYEDRAARKPLQGGEVLLQDINGKVISMTSNKVGNFWTYTPIGSNPYTVVGKSTNLPLYSYDANGNLIPADSTAPQTWQYKSWVKNGGHTLPMVTLAPVGGATILSDGTPDKTSRMGCSMHHAALGSRGGLWVSSKSSLSSYPATGLSFKKHILPIFRSKCAPCHIPGETWTRVVTKSDIDGSNTKIDYSKALDLTSYTGSTVTVSGTAWTKKGVSDAGIRGSILPKTDGTMVHGGGKFWSAGDPDYEAIKKWIAEGAQNN